MRTTDNIAVDLDEADQPDFAARVREPDERPEFDEQIAFCEPANLAPVVKPKSKSAARSQAEIVKSLYECNLTEDGLAEAFKAKHESQIKYDHDSGLWYVYHKGVWRQEKTKLAFSWARQVCRDLAMLNAVDEKLGAILGRASTAGAVERFAQADRAFAATSEIWDQDHFLLGTPGGTVDLRTGDLYDARPDDFITKLAAVTPSKTADCPLWLKFLRETMNDDKDLIAFLQRYCGYMLTGDIREHALLFVYGPGGNGKSVLLNTVSGILGEYCRTAPMETFTASKSDRHPTELAMLRGARMVCASETEEGRAWAESKIKQITGGDVISARFMRQDFFEFKPQFKLVVIGNHKPNLRNVDDAMRRRFNIVPFLYKPPNPDKKLEDKLRDEWPGILRWAIDGCLAWQSEGLVRAKVVLDATAEYFSEQDTFQQWIEDCCETGARALSETTGNLFHSWTQYALASGEQPRTKKWFADAMQRQGYEPVKRLPGTEARGYLRISLKKSDSGPHWNHND